SAAMTTIPRLRRRESGKALAAKVVLRLEGRRLAPAPAGNGSVLGDLCPRLGVVHRQATPPLGVGDQRRAELWVVRKAGVICGEADQRNEPMPLSGRDRE